MSDAAVAAWPNEDDATGRPGFRDMLLLTVVGGAFGWLLAALILSAPALLGVATASSVTWDSHWFPVETTGGLVADAAVVVAVVWGCTWGIRGLCRVGNAPLPASSWTALTLLPAVVLASASLADTKVVVLLIAIALRFTAFRADGTARPEPLDVLPPAARHALRVAIPVLAIGIATAYAIFHPLRQMMQGEGTPLKPGTTTVPVYLTPFTNDGGRPVRILGIEPGVERGYALHLAGVARARTGVWRPEQGPTIPFRPFTLAPHRDADNLMLLVSRAGCRPGASGRIESVRVRYRLGGERTMLLALDEPLTLSC